MIVMGIDPGTRLCHWSLLDTRGTSPRPLTFAYQARGSVDADGPCLDNLFARIAREGYAIDVVAVETVAGFAFKPTASRGGGQAVVAALIQTQGVAKLIAENARAKGFRVEEMPAAKWRGLVCRNQHAKNPVIKEAVRRFCAGWPIRSSNHERDACGVAMGVTMAIGGEPRKAVTGT